MDPNGPEAQHFLAELYQRTAGDVSAQVSMYDVGAALDLEKTAAGKLAEDLIGEGLVEVKTLSGGIGITAAGIDRVKAAGIVGESASGGLALGNGTVLETEGKEAVAAFLREVQSALSRAKAPYKKMEELVIDIKTVEVQLLSPNPKTAVIRELLRSMGRSLASVGCDDLSETIEKSISQ